jgi:hypothetical protein
MANGSRQITPQHSRTDPRVSSGADHAKLIALVETLTLKIDEMSEIIAAQQSK